MAQRHRHDGTTEPPDRNILSRSCSTVMNIFRGNQLLYKINYLLYMNNLLLKALQSTCQQNLEQKMFERSSQNRLDVYIQTYER
ncbi:hypothetical protein ACP275_05G067100 [Erythranthe tilingii]